MLGYIPVEYPKWVAGVVVQNKSEEEARLTKLAEAAAEARAAKRARPLSPAGVRMRRTRERRREGKQTIRCDISTDQIEALTKAGFIDPAKQNDRAEVARGVGRLLDGLARSDPVVTPGADATF